MATGPGIESARVKEQTWFDINYSQFPDAKDIKVKFTDPEGELLEELFDVEEELLEEEKRKIIRYCPKAAGMFTISILNNETQAEGGPFIIEVEGTEEEIPTEQIKESDGTFNSRNNHI